MKRKKDALYYKKHSLPQLDEIDYDKDEETENSKRDPNDSYIEQSIADDKQLYIKYKNFFR